MRVDIRIDSEVAGSVSSGPPTAAAEHPAADTAPVDAGAAGAGVGAGVEGAAIDAGPPSADLMAEIAAAGGDGAVLGARWTTIANGQGADAIDAGSAPD